MQCCYWCRILLPNIGIIKKIYQTNKEKLINFVWLAVNTTGVLSESLKSSRSVRFPWRCLLLRSSGTVGWTELELRRSLFKTATSNLLLRNWKLFFNTKILNYFFPFKQEIKFWSPTTRKLQRSDQIMLWIMSWICYVYIHIYK